MPIKTYSCIISDFNSYTSGVVKTVGVLRGRTEPIVMKVSSARSRTGFQFDSVSGGINISEGMYDSSMTFFGRDNYDGSGAKERTDGSLFDYYYSDKFAIHFPGGCSFSLTSYNAVYTFTYATPHDTVSSSIYTNSRYDAVGLMSDDIYTYDVDKSSPSRTVQV